jgi:hypothetical protein
MAKASDLRNKLGTGGITGGSGQPKVNPFAAPPVDPSTIAESLQKEQDHKIDKGHEIRKAHKPLGGAGGAGGRPKV